jgi:phytoene dehydrogenase-like protein
MTHVCTRLIQQNGGRIFLNSRVEKILIENGKATGVRLADGMEVESKVAVVCGGRTYMTSLNFMAKRYTSSPAAGTVSANTPQ